MSIPSIGLMLAGENILEWVVSSDDTDFNMKTEADLQAAGGDATIYSKVKVTIDSGVVIAGTSAGRSAYGFDVGTGWDSGQTLIIINNGTITGKGGNGGNGGSPIGTGAPSGGNIGGTALLGRTGLTAIEVTNNGTIQGGGGGGGASSGSSSGSVHYGGGGGGGGAGGASDTGGSGGSGFTLNMDFAGQNGNAGSLSAGGTGGEYGGAGTGGNPGVDGAGGNAGPTYGATSGGAHGYSIDGYSHITYTDNGTTSGDTNG